MTKLISDYLLLQLKTRAQRDIKNWGPRNLLSSGTSTFTSKRRLQHRGQRLALGAFQGVHCRCWANLLPRPRLGPTFFSVCNKCCLFCLMGNVGWRVSPTPFFPWWQLSLSFGSLVFGSSETVFGTYIFIWGFHSFYLYTPSGVVLRRMGVEKKTFSPGTRTGGEGWPGKVWCPASCFVCVLI